jgi:hypothetical protein
MEQLSEEQDAISLPAHQTKLARITPVIFWCHVYMWLLLLPLPLRQNALPIYADTHMKGACDLLPAACTFQDDCTFQDYVCR